MSGLKRKIALVAILVISHLAFYAFGSFINRKEMLGAISVQFDQTNARLNLGRYIEYRDIASDIKMGKYVRAECSAKLGASAMYDDLKSCLANQSCRVAIEQEIPKVAPEILGKAPLEFTYLKSTNGIRSCK